MLPLRKILRAISGLRINNNKPLLGQQLDYILVGSMYAAQQTAYLNSYTTGLSKKEIKIILEDYWSIYDSQEAKETLNSLLNRNDDNYISVLYDAYENKDKYVDILKSGLPSEEDLFEQYIQTYRQITNVIPDIIDQKIFDNFSTLKRTRDSAWNYGRCTFIARCCYEVGYLTELEFKQYLENSYNGLKRFCKTWKEYTSSYIYGRALWGGPYNDGMISIANDLLNNIKSPLRNKYYI